MEVTSSNHQRQGGQARPAVERIQIQDGPTAPISTTRPSWGHDLRLILILVLFAAGIRVWLICHTEVAARDSIGFIRYAIELEKQPWPEVFRHSLQHPGYPILLLAVSQPVRHSMGGTSPLSMQVSAQIASALASLLLVIPMFCLGRELFDRRVGFWATLMFQCLPVAAHVMSDGLSEATFLLFAASGLLLGVRALRTGSLLRFACCGLFGGLAYLTRPEGALLIVAVGLVLFGMQLTSKWRRPWRQVALCGASLALAAMVVGSPFAIIIGGFSPKPTAKRMLNLSGEVNDNELPAPEGPAAGRPTDPRAAREQLATPAALLAVYAPTRLHDRSWWAFKAIAIELLKGYLYVISLPLLLGLWIFRKQFRTSPAVWLLLVLCGLHTVVLWRLANVMGYISDRHVLLLVLCGLYPAAAGCIMLSNQLALGASLLWARYRGRAALTAGQTAWLAWLLLAPMATIGIPEALKPMHANRSGHREAGQWLAEHAQPADQVFDPFCWAHYYAGRVFQEGAAPPLQPGYTPINYVIVERSNHEHIRLPDVPKLEKFASFGRPVYHWPENKSEGNAKVLVYQVTAEDKAKAKKRMEAQPVKQTLERNYSQGSHRS